MNAAFMLDGEYILAIVRQIQLPPLAAGPVPITPKFDAVSFEPGGTILLDGSAKLRIGGLDVKAKITLKLLDSQTIRIRLIYLKVSGNDVLWAVRMGAEEFLTSLALPVKVVINESDFYAEFKMPVDFVPIKAILTENNQLAIVPDVPDVTAAMAWQKANAAKAAHHGGSMAAVIQNIEPDTAKTTGSTSGIAPGVVPIAGQGVRK